MGTEDDARALLAQTVDQQVKFLGGDRVQPHRGFVQQQQARLAEHRLSQAQTLAHALGIGFHPTVCGPRKPDLLEQFVHLRQGGSFEAGEIPQSFAATELRVERHVFRQVTELAAHVGLCGSAAEYVHLAGAGLEQAKDQFHHRGLARTVVAKQAQHLAFAQTQGQIVQHGHAAVTLADPFDFDGDHKVGRCVWGIVGRFIRGKLSFTPGDFVTGKLL